MSPQDFTKIKKVNGFASGLENAVAARAKADDIAVTFVGKPGSKHDVEYDVPAKLCRFTPQFILGNAICIQSIGYMVAADRQKFRLVQQQHPGLDLRFVFTNSKKLISKKSPTTYGMWARRYGFKFSEKSVPAAWLKESATPAALAAVRSMKPSTRKPSIAV